MSEVFGSIIDGSMVEDDIQAHLENWLPTYLAQLAQDRGQPRGAWLREDGSAVGSWTRTTEFEISDSTALPAVLLINSGLSGEPIREGDGSFRATWVVGIGGVVSAGGNNPALNTSRLAKRFAACIRWAMMQNSSLGSAQVEGLSWLDEGYDDVTPSETRTLASFRLVFAIEYSNVLNSNLGPGTPDPLPDPVTTPYPDWGQIPDADHIHVNITKEP